MRGAIIWWCVYDVMVVAFIINLLDLKRRPGSGQGATIAFWIYSAYSVAFGFPLGFISKVGGNQEMKNRKLMGNGSKSHTQYCGQTMHLNMNVLFNCF